MADLRALGGGPSGRDDGGGGPVNGPSSSDVTPWLRRWRERLADDDAGMPEDEARLVVQSVLEEIHGGQAGNLDRAGRAWGRAHRSVTEMVGRLSAFREALAATGVDDPLQMHRALDRVTAAATEEVLHRLERASRTDALTGVGNRRAFDETLAAALSAASRQGHDVTVVAVDLDGLKRINDSSGHAAGDAALMALVRSFYVALRDEDTIFRVGGDEFVILLPFTSVSAAELLMERIHSGDAPAFTWGAAGYPGDGAEAAAVVAAADDDLYRRRQQRRSAVVSPAKRPIMSALRSEERSPLMRWAWIPAAAVLVVSLVAALVSTTTGPGKLAARRPPPVVATKPGGSPTNPNTTPGANSGSPTSGSPNAPSIGFGGSTPAALTTSFSPIPSTGGASSGGSPGGGGPGSGGGPTPGSNPPPSSSGGVLGTVSNLVAPVPLLGGSNGLVAVVSQVLTGAPSTTAATTAPTGTSSSAGVLGGLLGTVNSIVS